MDFGLFGSVSGEVVAGEERELERERKRRSAEIADRIEEDMKRRERQRRNARIDISSLNSSQTLVSSLVVKLRSPVAREVLLDGGGRARGFALEVVVVGGCEGVCSDNL